MKRFSFALALLLVISLFTGIFEAHALPFRILQKKTLPQKLLESKKLRPRLQNIFQGKEDHEKVPLIIRFKEAPGEKHLNLLQRKGPIKKRFRRFMQGAAIELSQRQLEELVENDIIEAVYHDFEIAPLLSKSTEQIDVPTVKQGYGVNGAGVRVAVLDTGVAGNHSALKGRIVASKDFTSEGTSEDLNGHGTHVACIIGCNDDVYQGVAPGAQILNAKIMDQNGVGSASSVLEALEWSIEQGAQVINMSLGAESDSCDGTDILSSVIDDVVESGVTVVVSSGNTGPDEKTINIPGCSTEALTVGAMDSSGNDVASFSSYGPTADERVKPDILAPGVNITAASYEGGWVTYSGTSMSAPHVAGVVALMLEADSTLSSARIKEILYSTADALDIDNEKQGYGVIDSLEAIGEVTGVYVSEDFLEEEPIPMVGVPEDTGEEEPIPMVGVPEEDEDVSDEKRSSDENEKRSSDENDTEKETASMEQFDAGVKEKIQEGKRVLEACLRFAKAHPPRRKQCVEKFFAHRREVQKALLNEEEQAAEEAIEELVSETEEIAEAVFDEHDVSEEILSRLSELLETIDMYNFVEDSLNVIEEAVAAINELLSASSIDEKALSERLVSLEALASDERKNSRLAKYARGMIPFKDTDDHEWYFAFVSEITGNGWVSGYEDVSGNPMGEFRPENNLTVAEAMKIVLESAGKGKSIASGSPRQEAVRSHWAEKYFLRGEELSVTLALDSNVLPNREITRAEVVRIILEVYGISPDSISESSFSDVDASLLDEAPYIEYAYAAGIIEGYEDGTFGPYNMINRAEMAKMVIQAVEMLM